MSQAILASNIGWLRLGPLFRNDAWLELWLGGHELQVESVWTFFGVESWVTKAELTSLAYSMI